MLSPCQQHLGCLYLGFTEYFQMEQPDGEWRAKIPKTNNFKKVQMKMKIYGFSRINLMGKIADSSASLLSVGPRYHRVEIRGA